MASKRAVGALARVVNFTASFSRAASSSAVARAAAAAPQSSSSVPPSADEVEQYLLRMDAASRNTSRASRPNLHVATLHLRAHDNSNLDMFTDFAMRSAHALQMPTSGIFRLPTTRELTTVIKSPFVHKKAQQNFERRTLRRAIKVFDKDLAVVDLWLRYLKRNSVGGIGMKAYIHEHVEYGFARGEIAEVESKFSNFPQTSVDIEAAAAEIVKWFGGPVSKPGGEKAKAKVEEAKVEGAKVEEAKVEEANVEEANVEEAKVEEAKVEESAPKAEGTEQPPTTKPEASS